MFSVWAVLTFVRFTVTSFPLTLGDPETEAVPPLPGVTLAPLTAVIDDANLTTT